MTPAFCLKNFSLIVVPLLVIGPVLNASAQIAESIDTIEIEVLAPQRILSSSMKFERSTAVFVHWQRGQQVTIETPEELQRQVDNGHTVCTLGINLSNQAFFVALERREFPLLYTRAGKLKFVSHSRSYAGRSTDSYAPRLTSIHYLASNRTEFSLGGLPLAGIGNVENGNGLSSVSCHGSNLNLTVLQMALGSLVQVSSSRQ